MDLDLIRIFLESKAIFRQTQRKSYAPTPKLVLVAAMMISWESSSSATLDHSLQISSFLTVLTSAATDIKQTEIGRCLRRLHLQTRKRFASDANPKFDGDANDVEPVGSKTRTEHGPVSRKRRRFFEAGHFTGPAPFNLNMIKLYTIIFNVFARILRFFLKSGLEIKVFKPVKIFIFVNERRCAHVRKAILGSPTLH